MGQTVNIICDNDGCNFIGSISTDDTDANDIKAQTYLTNELRSRLDRGHSLGHHKTVVFRDKNESLVK